MKFEALESSWTKNYFPSSFLSRQTYFKSLFPKLSTNCNFLFLLWNWGCMFNLKVEKVCISDELKLEISSPFLVSSRCISFHSYLKFQYFGVLMFWGWDEEKRWKFTCFNSELMLIIKGEQIPFSSFLLTTAPPSFFFAPLLQFWRLWLNGIAYVLWVWPVLNWEMALMLYDLATECIYGLNWFYFELIEFGLCYWSCLCIRGKLMAAF